MKRLFFAFDLLAPWPNELPRSGRLLAEDDRHMTMAFLGQADYSKLKPLLQEIPLPPFKVGLAGYFDKILFLPKQHPRVAAWHMAWLDDPEPFLSYLQCLHTWLRQAGFLVDSREGESFLPHITVCRAPFDFAEWRKMFYKMPCALGSFHLYESLGQLRYQSLWSHSLASPFEEIEHTADLAFKITGENLQELFCHAFVALAFKDPRLLKYYREENVPIGNIDDVITQLNAIVSHMDTVEGVSIKAVCFHGDVIQEKDGLLTWEMIVDV